MISVDVFCQVLSQFHLILQSEFVKVELKQVIVFSMPTRLLFFYLPVADESIWMASGSPYMGHSPLDRVKWRRGASIELFASAQQ